MKNDNCSFPKRCNPRYLAISLVQLSDHPELSALGAHLVGARDQQVEERDDCPFKLTSCNAIVNFQNATPTWEAMWECLLGWHHLLHLAER